MEKDAVGTDEIFAKKDAVGTDEVFGNRETVGTEVFFMKVSSWFLVKKHNLLAVAGMVWLLAGFNVARLGIIDYGRLLPITVLQILLSLAVFCVFGIMFYRMVGKHFKRILGYEQEKRPIWNFFDGKAYAMMSVMMGGGIWLRSSGIVPSVFIAVFYTGLGCALAMAGTLFWKRFLGMKN